jgi:branched-chain amino acid transport system permease protein
VFHPLRGATGQQALVATVGLALALDEFLRLAQGNRQLWTSPMFNAPFGLARAGGFIVTSALDTLLAGGFAVASGVTLLAVMRWSRFGRRWRAYADDPLAAELMGVSPRAILAQTFALAAACAGLSGFVMTMYYGSVGYAAATSLGLKALVAAILGGVGSVPGALLGGLLVGGFEAAWQTCFSVDYRDVAVYSMLAFSACALDTRRPPPRFSGIGRPGRRRLPWPITRAPRRSASTRSPACARGASSPWRSI